MREKNGNFEQQQKKKNRNNKKMKLSFNGCYLYTFYF